MLENLVLAAKCLPTSGKEEENMSRIGRAPIELPQGVTVDQTVEGEVIVTGPKGTLRQNH